MQWLGFAVRPIPHSKALLRLLSTGVPRIAKPHQQEDQEDEQGREMARLTACSNTPTCSAASSSLGQ